MKPGVNKPLAVALVLIAALTLAFVLANSLQGKADSWEESGAIATLFEPVLRRLYNLFCGACSQAGVAVPMVYESFVRKVAHFVEYALLGAECAGLTVLLTRRVLSPYLWADLFIVLIIGVLDEFIQGFVGRTSLVSDVLLDFSGALTGIAAVMIIAAIAGIWARKDS